MVLLLSLLGSMVMAITPPATYTINNSQNSNSAVPWTSSDTTTGNFAQYLQARVVSIFSWIKKRPVSMFRTIGIVLYDEAGDVRDLTKRLTSSGSRFTIAVEQIASSSVFSSLQSLDTSASFKAGDITTSTMVEGKMGPGDPGARISQVCGMKTTYHEDCHHAPGDPGLKMEVFC